MPLAREKPLTVNWCEPRTVSVTERDHEVGGGGVGGGTAIASGGGGCGWVGELEP